MPKTFYEWNYERVDADGDIIDHTYADKLKDLNMDEDGFLVLVRSVYENERLVDRTWAYVISGMELPAHFEDSYGKQCEKVPQRFRKEIAKIMP